MNDNQLDDAVLRRWLHSFDHSDRAAWPLLVEEMRKTVGGLRPERDSFIPPPPPPEPEKPEPRPMSDDNVKAKAGRLLAEHTLMQEQSVALRVTPGPVRRCTCDECDLARFVWPTRRWRRKLAAASKATFARRL